MWAELTAMQEALQCFLRLPKSSLLAVKSTLFCSDSLSDLQLLTQEQAALESALAPGQLGPPALRYGRSQDFWSPVGL